MSDREKQPLCSAFWTSLTLRPDREVHPCCSFENNSDRRQFVGESGSSLREIYLSPEFEHYRKTSLEGRWNAGCSRCENVEKRNLESTRFFVNRDHPVLSAAPDADPLSQVSSLEIFLDNQCNLKCVMCSSRFSSAWVGDEKKLGLKVNPCAPLTSSDLAQSVRSLPNLSEMKVLGGEPMLSPNNLFTLQAIPKDRRKKIKVKYHTNATVWPSPALLEVWSDFLQIRIDISLDAAGPVNDYIRFPSKWAKVSGNILKYIAMTEAKYNIEVGFSSTISVYNLFFLREFEDWHREVVKLTSHDLTPFRMVVDNPSYLAPQCLPRELKEKAWEMNRGASAEAKNILEATLEDRSSDLWEQAYTYTKSLDAIRKIRVQDYIPFWPV